MLCALVVALTVAAADANSGAGPFSHGASPPGPPRSLRSGGHSASAGPTPAERIEKASAAFATLDYDIAADEAMAALADPRASHDELVQAGLLAGIANRIVGRDSDARMSFRVALLAEPDAALPGDAPPKVRAFFDIIRRELAAETARALLEKAKAAPPSVAAASPPPAPAAAALPPKAPPPGPISAAWVTAGAGALALVGGGALAVVSDAALGDAEKDGAEKQAWLVVGWTAVAVAGAGAVAAAAGAAVGALD